jgi:hypothetical protein
VRENSTEILCGVNFLSFPMWARTTVRTIFSFSITNYKRIFYGNGMVVFRCRVTWVYFPSGPKEKGRIPRQCYFNIL